MARTSYIPVGLANGLIRQDGKEVNVSLCTDSRTIGSKMPGLLLLPGNLWGRYTGHMLDRVWFLGQEMHRDTKMASLLWSGFRPVKGNLRRLVHEKTGVVIPVTQFEQHYLKALAGIYG